MALKRRKRKYSVIGNGIETIKNYLLMNVLNELII